MREDAMKEFVQHVARFLVTNPEEVEVRQVNSETSSVLLELKVAQDDVGRVIGKQGRTATALRTILKAAGARVNRRVTLEIIE